MPNQDHIAALLDQLGELRQGDDAALDALVRRAQMIIRNMFGATSDYLSDLDRISFYPMVHPADAEYVNSSWNSGVSQLRNLLNTMADEVVLFGSAAEPDTPIAPTAADQADRPHVFLVHGHDNQAKSETARFLEQLDLQVTILHERASAGQTVIEKFERESAKAAFAVVLLTGDDKGKAKNDPDPLLLRARQNVVLELGYFLGKLGRSKVAALVQHGVEIPSDYAGVVYISLDNSESWKLGLAREIKNSGIDIDLNKAL